MKSHIIAPNIVVAMAALRAVNFGQELGFTKVVIEGGVLKVVQALNKEEEIGAGMDI